MSTRKVLDEILVILTEIQNIVNNTNWRDYSEVRVRILVTSKMDDLKHILGEIPENDVFSSDEASIYFENILDKITKILGIMPEKLLPLQWYELELWRLRFASMYALQWGKGGELQVAGTAHALANALIGIETIDVKNLIVDWEHQEFDKRRKLILNYLSSAYLFFFTLCTSLNHIYKHDLEHWLSEGLKASSEYLKYTEHFWDVPKNVKLYKKLHRNVRDPNYSPYYAVFAGIDYIISFLIDMQKFFFKTPLKLDFVDKNLDVSTPQKFFDTVNGLLDKAQFYVADFKKHVQEGCFDINEDPLNDRDIVETIYELNVTKVWIKGLYALYRLIVKDISSELHILENTVIPELFKYIDKYKNLFDQPDFLESQIADGINATLEELILFTGVTILKTNKSHLINKIDDEYGIFFKEKIMKRYPTLNGLYTIFKITRDIENSENKNLEQYAIRLIKLSQYTLYEPRNSFAYYLLGKLILTILKKISKEEFLVVVREKFEELISSFSQSLISEIEIYLTNLELALNNQPTSFNMSRLLSPQYFDPYSIFVPDISKLAFKEGFEEIVYLPFNLLTDYLAIADVSIIDKIETASRQSDVKQLDTSLD